MQRRLRSVAALVALAVIPAASEAVTGVEHCDADCDEVATSDALLQVTKWNVVHSIVSSSASSHASSSSKANVSVGSADPFEVEGDWMEQSLEESIPWVVGASGVVGRPD